MTQIKFEDVARETAREFGLSKGEMFGSGRPNRIAHPRHIAIVLASELTQLSYSSVARRFGFDHSTGAYARRIVPERLAASEKLRASVAAIRARLAAIEAA